MVKRKRAKKEEKKESTFMVKKVKKVEPTFSIKYLAELKSVEGAKGLEGYYLRQFCNQMGVTLKTMVTEDEFNRLYKKRYGITL